MKAWLRISDALLFFFMVILLLANPHMFADSEPKQDHQQTASLPTTIILNQLQQESSEETLKEYLYKLYSKIVVV